MSHVGKKSSDAKRSDRRRQDLPHHRAGMGGVRSGAKKPAGERRRSPAWEPESEALRGLPFN
jgi:hypothetical protein